MLAPPSGMGSVTGSSSALPSRTASLRCDQRPKKPSAMTSTRLLYRTNRHWIAKPVRQRSKTLRPLAPPGLGEVMFVHKSPQPRKHSGGGWYLFYRFLRVEPAAGIVVAQAHHLRPGQWFPGAAGLLFHTPQDKPAGRRRAEVDVVSVDISLEQFDFVAWVQPAFFVEIFIKQACCAAKTVLVRNHIGQHPAPGLPSAHGAGDALAAHDDGNFQFWT